MIYRCRFICLFLALFTITNIQAQQKRLNFEVEGGISRYQSNEINGIFPLGINLFFGPKWVIGTAERIYIKGSIGIKWHFHNLDDNFTEHLATLRGGPEFQYEAFTWGDMVLIPTFKLDFAWCTNFDTQGNIYDAINDEFVNVHSEDYMSGWGLGRELGLKVEIKRRWYLRTSFELFRPRLVVRNTVIQGDMGASYIHLPAKSFNLNSFNLTIGFNI
ncbi:hypothetical protein H8S90_25645 [Olivibacter sp. SDN3]|uniref:hypothetical protein n=1 Tax=Olivibacter sp. SDN3 TaxID=2764720 RepID=UPI001650DD93|nr:hypothetical protein [Olivibacter sp. SDN3]QNL50026.1 hypothetical protein H8S90_25645 [Olivibacter sp. SDN3]